MIVPMDLKEWDFGELLKNCKLVEMEKEGSFMREANAYGYGMICCENLSTRKLPFEGHLLSDNCPMVIFIVLADFIVILAQMHIEAFTIQNLDSIHIF
jgi:hypothetical protein